jgi:nicotinamide-nucleotide amidase
MSALMSRVAAALTEKGLHLVVAESCTGGMLAARLTDRPGASRFFDAGLVTYSDEAKQTVLGVEAGTLAEHGAVSEAVAREMLVGARRITAADAAIAITGIAGPDGGTPTKPVGTVWIGASVRAASELRCFHFDGGRGRVRTASVDASLELLQRLLEAVT